MASQITASPHALHRFAALTEMFTWTLLALGMILKYGGFTDKVVPITGAIHGFGFLCFLVITTALWINNSWSVLWGVAGLLVSVVPWGAWPFLKLAERHGKLAGAWRFRADGTTPVTIPEKILAQFFRHPLPSTVITLIIVAGVFGVLLQLGPPVDVESAITD